MPASTGHTPLARARCEIYDRAMEAESSDPRARYRRWEEPIPFDQMIESVDVAKHPDAQDDAFREQQWLIRNAMG